MKFFLAPIVFSFYLVPLEDHLVLLRELSRKGGRLLLERRINGKVQLDAICFVDTGLDGNLGDRSMKQNTIQESAVYYTI